MDVVEERRHILKSTDEGDDSNKALEIRVYKRRWWVAFVFCLNCLAQSMVWETWGPIAESSELVFGWTDGTIAKITNMSSIVFTLLVLPFGTFMDTQGLRVSMLLCSTALLACTVVRCFTMDPGLFTSLAYLSSAVHGIGGMVSYSGTSLFAATWFSVKERTSITAIGSFCNTFGTTLSFIIAPQLVPGPVYTTADNISWTDVTLNKTASELKRYDVANMESMKKGIQYVLYVHASLTGLVFLMIITYFPAKPPSPPSITASIQRINYKEAFKKMLVNVQLWIIVMVCAIPRAFVGTWIAVFDVVVKPLGISQIEAGWVSFWHTLCGCSAGLILARFSDFLSSRRKGLVISLTIAGVICNIWTALLCDTVILLNTESLYASCILLGILSQGLMPLFYEMAAETAYPVGEGAAGGFLTLGVCFFHIIYFGLLSISGIGVSWMTWACVGSLILSLLLMICFKERNNR